MKQLCLAVVPVFLCGCGAVELPTSPSPAGSDASMVAMADAAAPAASSDDAAGKLDSATRDTKASPADTAAASGEDFPTGSFYGQTRCPKNALFCEDFEDALDAQIWTTTVKNGVAVDLDAKKAARGRRALHFKMLVPTGEKGAFVTTTMPFALAGNRLFVRYFMYIDRVTPDRWYWTFAASGSTPWCFARDGMLLPEYGMVLTPTTVTTGAPNTFLAYADSNTVSAYPQRVPLGTWTCWEYELHGDNGGEMILYLDDKPLRGAGLDIKGWAAPANPKLYFGLYNSHDDIIPKTDGFNIWIDGIAVGREKIGCAE